MAKQYAVLGLGKFGSAVALELASGGAEVMAVDKDAEIVNEIADSVTTALIADVTDPRIFKSLGIQNMDAAIICISEDMEASILATMMAKDSGVKNVIVKGMNEVHAKILNKIGADRVIMAEKETGMRLAKSLIAGGFYELFELSDSISIAELEIPSNWVGKNLIQLSLREHYGINVIAVKEGENIRIALDPKKPIRKGTVLILMGENKHLARLMKEEKIS